MKSLKRTLCLVLALVMVLGLFGIASATDFPDDNDIQYKEAVEVITGIGAIKGMGDGTFAPKATITRAQAAVMVARVALTNKIADDLKGVSSSFTDVTEAGGFGWAIPSIEYLVKEGVINGRGDGTFDPNGEISGYAVLKMLLCVLGYGAKDEYVGTGWDLQVAVDSNNKGLTVGRAEGTPALSAPATREEVALYCFNTLGAEVVYVSPISNTYATKTGTSTYKGAGSAPTLADEVYKFAAPVTGVINANGAVNSNCAKDGTTKVNNVDYKIDTGLDLVGHCVKIYSNKNAVNGVSAGYAVVDVSKVVTLDTAIDATAGTAAEQAASTAKFEAAFGTATVATTNVCLVDGSYNVTYKAPFAPGSTDTTTKLGETNFNTSTKIAPVGTYILAPTGANGAMQVVSHFEKATFAADVVKNVKAPTDKATGEIEFEATATLGTAIASNKIVIPKTGDTSSTDAQKYATAKIYDGIAKGDVVILQQTGAFITVSKAASVTGKINAFDSASTPNTITVGGTAYPYNSVVYAAVTKATTELKGFVASGDVGKGLVGDDNEYNVYLGPNNLVVAVAAKTSASNVVYVNYLWQENVSTGFGNAVVTKAQCVTLAGETVTYTVKSLGGMTAPTGTTTEDTKTPNTLAAVTIAYDTTLGTDAASFVPMSGTGFVVGTNARATATGAAAIVQGAKVVDAAGKCYLTDNTIFLFVDGVGAKTTVTRATGAQTTKDGSFIYMCTAADPSAVATSNYTVDCVVVRGKSTAAPSNGVMFVPAPFTDRVTEEYTNAAGTLTKAAINGAYIDGVATKVKTDLDVIGTIGMGFYTYSVNAQGIYSLDKDDDAGSYGAVTKVFNGLLSLTLKDGTTTNAPTDVPAASAFIVDTDYDAKIPAQQALVTAKTSLTDLAKDDYVAYTLAADGKSVTGIYYLGAKTEYAAQDYSKAIAAVTAGSTGGKYEVEENGGPAAVIPGETVTVTITVKTASTTTTYKAVTVVLKSDGTEIPGASVTMNEKVDANGTVTMTFTAPATIGTLSLGATEAAS